MVRSIIELTLADPVFPLLYTVILPSIMLDKMMTSRYILQVWTFWYEWYSCHSLVCFAYYHRLFEKAFLNLKFAKIFNC